MEDQAVTRELLHSRRNEEGHDVFVVREQSSGERFLIHSLAVDAAASTEARQSVVAAARQAVAFHHPSVLPVLNVEGSAQNLILMQSFPGGVLLADWLAQNGPMPPLAALQALRPFANALQRAQALGLVIPQVSPQDFIVGHNGASLICLCPPVPQGWWLEVSDPAFASPEQQRGQPCDVLSSLYSAGALLAHLVTGTQPAQGETWAAWVARQGFPPALKAAVLAVLHDSPPQRCTPAAWQQLLAEAGTGPPSVPARSVPPPQPPALTVTPSQGRRPEPPSPRAPQRAATPASRLRLLVGLVLAGLLVAVLGILQNVHQDTGRTADSNRPPADITAVPMASSRPVETHLPPSVLPQASEPVAEEPPASLSSTLPPPAEPPSAVLGTLPPPATPPPMTVADAPLPPAVEAPPLVASTPPTSLAPATAVPVAPMPPVAQAEARPARAATMEEELLEAARAAPSPRRSDLYREVLKAAPRNTEALHALVEKSLAEFPESAADLRDLRRWAAALGNLDDPLGDYTHGRLLLEEAKKSRDLRSAAASLTDAVTHLAQAADKGYGRAWFLLLQGLVNLHNVQQQAGNVRLASRTGRTLFEKIDAIPPEMPVADARLLAERLQQLVAERAAEGRPHPQAEFLRRVVQRLEAVTLRREETVSQAP